MARTRQITRPWTQQPQGALSIDWANPLTRGLVVAYSATSVAEITRQRLPSTSTASPIPGPRGIAHSTGVRKWSTGPLLPTARSTVVAVVSVDLPVWTQAYLLGHGEPWNQYLMALLYHNGASYFGGWASGGTGSLDQVTGIAVADLLTPRVYSVRNVGAGASDLHFHLDGRQTGSGSGSYGVSAITTPGAESGVGWIAANGADGSHSGMRVYGVWLWDRALTDDELMRVHANPWRVFKGLSTRLPVAAGGGPAIVLPSDGRLQYSAGAAGGDRKLYLTSGAISAKIGPDTGDRLITLSGGGWAAGAPA